MAYDIQNSTEMPSDGGWLPPKDDPFWKDAVNWLGGQIFGSSTKMPRSQYYGGALQGIVFFPGPFTVEAVTAALGAAPADKIAAARAAVVKAGPGFGTDYVPQTMAELAGALVAEAHGGRTGEMDSDEVAVIRAIQALAPDGVSGGVTTIYDPPGVLPTTAGGTGALGLAIAGAAVWLGLKAAKAKG